MLPYFPPLLAPEFASHTPESFLEHVRTLKRIPERKVASRPKAPPKPKLKLMAKAKLVELSYLEHMLPMPYQTVREGRKIKKHMLGVHLEAASKVLGLSLSLLHILFNKKGIFIS